MINLKKITKYLYRFFFYIVIIYSFLWFDLGRISFLPFSYIPFFLLGILAIIIYFFHYGFRFDPSDIPVIMLVSFFSVQPLLLYFTNTDFVLSEYIKDYIMFLFYFSIYFAFSGLIRKLDHDLIFPIIDSVIFSLSLAVAIGTLRFLLIDVSIGQYQFYNIVPPLRYRFFEVLLCLFGISYSYFLYFATKKRRYFVSFLAFSSCILLSGSRTGMLTLFFGFFVLSIRKNLKLTQIFKKLGLAIKLIPFVVILPLLLNYFSGGNVFSRIERLKELSMFFQLDLDTALHEKKDLKRMIYITGGLQMMNEYPLSGVGLGNFQEKFPYPLMKIAGLEHVTRPHNMYISIGATAGYIGLICFFIWFISTYVKIYSGLKYVICNDERAIIKGSLGFLFLLLIFFIGYETETNPIFWAILGITTGSARGLIQAGKMERVYSNE